MMTSFSIEVAPCHDLRERGLSVSGKSVEGLGLRGLGFSIHTVTAWVIKPTRMAPGLRFCAAHCSNNM